jgi:hypothetical protein
MIAFEDSQQLRVAYKLSLFALDPCQIETIFYVGRLEITGFSTF